MKRYLLLDEYYDNIIIDTEKYNLKKEKNDRNEQYILTGYLKTNPSIFFKFRAEEIEKESDNVNEFIDKAHDLVKLRLMRNNYIIVEAKNINGSILTMENIVAIYKPNTQGNYIRVWSEN